MTEAPRSPHLTVPLDKAFDRASFACGDPEFDAYLRTRASQDASRNIAAVYVALETLDAGGPAPARIRGYYTLSSHGIAMDGLPEDIRKRLPRYEQAPAVLLGRLAVDLADRGGGLGRRLVFDALRRVLDANRGIAAWAVVVDARRPELVPWYVDRFGFLPLPGRPTPLFLPVRQAETLLSTR